jgi:uncharacterized protein YjbJ (UPF0337 family)
MSKIYKENNVNKDIVQGKWKQIRGKTKEWWGKLTDDDLDVINGNREQLIGKLQERYGYTKDRATREVNERLAELERVSEERHRV